MTDQATLDRPATNGVSTRDVASRECVVDFHRELWDLNGTLKALWTNPAGEPANFVHEDQDSKVTVTLALEGSILSYLCNTELCATLAFETIGAGVEFDRVQWRKVNPCKDGGNVITFDFEIPAGTLSAGHCGKQYELAVTVGSKDCCGKPGFLWGACKPVGIVVLPADENN